MKIFLYIIMLHTLLFSEVIENFPLYTTFNVDKSNISSTLGGNGLDKNVYKDGTGYVIYFPSIKNQNVNFTKYNNIINKNLQNINSDQLTLESFISIEESQELNTTLSKSFELITSSRTSLLNDTFFYIESYGYLGSNAATITEVKAFDEQGNEIALEFKESLSYCSGDSRQTYIGWEDSAISWGYLNMFDNDFNYVGNSSGYYSTYSLAYLINDCLTKMKIGSIDNTSIIYNVRIWIGSPEERIPKYLNILNSNDEVIFTYTGNINDTTVFETGTEY